MHIQIPLRVHSKMRTSLFFVVLLCVVRSFVVCISMLNIRSGVCDCLLLFVLLLLRAQTLFFPVSPLLFTFFLFGWAIKWLSLLHCCINLLHRCIALWCWGAQPHTCPNEAIAIFNGSHFVKINQRIAFIINPGEIKTDLVRVCIIFPVDFLWRPSRMHCTVFFLNFNSKVGSGDCNQTKSYLAIQIELTVHSDHCID